MSDQYDPDFREQLPGGQPPPPPPPPAAPTAPRGYSPEDVRMWTIAAHASAIPSAFFALAFMGPLVVWLLRRDDPVSGAHAKEALHFNLNVMAWAAVSFLLMFVLIGFVLLPAVGVFWLVNVLRATAAVADGRTFRYPLTLRLF